jgi:sterol desaturase/sphingolipid hydroxylase (fatty acid hydroxylase superfamily)
MTAVSAPLVIVAGALVLVALERVAPYRAGQRLLRPGFWVDLVGYGLAQSYVLGLVIDRIIRALDAASGASRLHLVSAWPVAAQVAFFVVTHDLYIYSFHRLQHRSPLLWRIHEAHHSTLDVDWLSGARSHALEILANQTIEFAPIVLLGAAPEVALWKGVISAVWGMYIHSNVDARAGVLGYVVNGPELHRWHHSADAADGGFNFATKLAIWDWLFGTARRPGGKPRAYGLSDVDFPAGFLAQQAAALRRAGSDARQRRDREAEQHDARDPVHPHEVSGGQA